MTAAHRAPLAGALALAALAALAVWGAWSIPEGPDFSTVGPSAFPRVLSGTLALLAIAAVIQALRGKIPDEARSTEEPLLPGANARVGWVLAGMVFSPLGLYLFGFLVGAMIGFGTVARAFGAKNGWAIIGWSAASTLVVWLVFDKVLTLKLGNQLIMLPF